MKAFKRFSIAEWLKQVGGACRRFPVAVLLLTFLSLMLISLNHGYDFSDKWLFFYLFYPATGSLLAVSLQLLTEDFKKRSVAVLTQVVVHLLWLGISLYLTQFDRFSMPQFVAVSATVVTMALSLFLLCFYRKGDDVPFWNFSFNLFITIVSSLVVCGILTLGIVLFLQSLDWLFGMKVEQLFADVPAVCMVWLAPVLAMSQIPAGADKYDHEVVSYSGFIKGVAQYLFIPLLLLYMATLYVYAAKILFTWQLPVGWVCYLVSASMLGMVLLIFITYPLQLGQGNSIFKKLLRWLPLAMLPLLVLMSVAIGRRLSDYGITVSRLYVLVFNIWCYVVCIGLLITRNRRLWWVPASFAAVLFLISVGPQAIPSMTQRQLKSEARKAFTASGINQLPLSGEQYEQWIKSVDKKVAKSIDAKLHYLQKDYGYNSITDLVGKDVVLGRIYQDEDELSSSGAYEHYSNWRMIHRMEVPSGYRHMEWIEKGDDCLADVKGDTMTIVLTPQNGKEQTFELDVKALIALDEGKWDNETPEPLVLQNGETMFVVNHFTLSINDKKTVDFLNIDGVLFTK